MVEIQLLGRFAARRDGDEIPQTVFGGRLVRVLLRLLATRRGTFVSHDVLAEALWPRRLPADPVANLQVLVNRARRALGDPFMVVTGPGGYAFAADRACTVDAERFLDQVAQGREQLATARPDEALLTFQAALDSWGEPLPEDAYAEWAQEYRTTLARACQQALEDGAAAALAARRTAEAVALSEQAVAREPLREAAHLLLAQAHAASGDPVAARRTIARLRRQLADELGIEASTAVSELERTLLEARPHPPSTRHAALPMPSSFTELAFVGRDRELEVILRTVGCADAGIVLLSGGPGAGKSRLLGEVVARSPAAVLRGRAFAPEREEAWSLVRSVLREAIALDLGLVRGLHDRAASALAGILPELDELRAIDHDTPIDAESRRALALEAGARLIDGASARGALLVIDDLQWVDATSLTLLSSTLLRTPRLGAILAYRPEEVAPDAPVASFLRDLESQWARVKQVPLPSLPREAIVELVADAELVEMIALHTIGTPLAVTEVLRTLAGQGHVERCSDGRWRACTRGAIGAAMVVARTGQLRSITARVARQRPRASKALLLLALLGRETPARTLANAGRVDQATVLDDLEELARAELVCIGDAGWAVAHDLVGEAVIENLERSHRACLHESLATALAAEHADVAEIARHLAGAGDRAAAARAYARGARDRLDRYEATEAGGLAECGLGLDPDAATRTALLEIRAEGRAIAGDLEGARADLRTVLEFSRSGSDRARVLARIATLILGDDLARADDLVTMAVTEAGSDTGARAEALTVAAFVDVNTGRLDRVDQRAAEALTLFERSGDGRGLARILDARAGERLFRGRLREAADMYDRAARLHLDSGSLLQAGTPRCYRGWCLVLMGRAEEGLADVDDALELERTLGQIEGVAICMLYRGEALRCLGRLDEARDSMTAALGTFRRLGVREQAANALWLLGGVEEFAGDLEVAEALTRQALEVCPDMPFVSSMAAGRLAAVLVARGDLDGATALAERVLADGIPLARYEAGLVCAEIAVRRREADAHARLVQALAEAEAAQCTFSPVFHRLQTMAP